MGNQEGQPDIGAVVGLAVIGFAIYQTMKSKVQPGKKVLPGAVLDIRPVALPGQPPAFESASRFGRQQTSFIPGDVLYLVAYIENTSKYEDGSLAPFNFYQLIFSVWEGSVLPGHGVLLRTVLNAGALNFGPGDRLAVYSDPFQEVKGTINRRDVGLKLYSKQNQVVEDGEWDDIYEVNPVLTSQPGASFFTGPMAVLYQEPGQ